MSRHRLITIVICLLAVTLSAFGQQAVPDKLVVLTFDDSVKSHFTVVRPILKEY